MEEKNNAPRGYKLTLTRLDSGEEILSEVIDCLIGSCHISGKKEGESKCIRVAACTNSTILTTVQGAREAAGDMLTGVCSDVLADALIAAGIGDVSELEVKCEVLQRDVDNLTRTLEEGREEFEEANHRAEVAERALENAVRDRNYLAAQIYLGAENDGVLTIDYYLKQAEKQLAKENKE